MTNADVVIDIFDSCIRNLSVLLDTSVGGWIGGCLVLLALVRLICALKRI